MALHALSAAVGVASTIQAAANSRLGQVANMPVFAAWVGYVIGCTTVLLIAVSSAYSGGKHLFGFTRTPQWFELCGGVCGGVFVLITVYIAPVTGVAVFFALVVFGQLGCSMLLDHIGFLGLPMKRVGAARIFCLVTALFGVALAASSERAGATLEKPEDSVLSNSGESSSFALLSSIAVCGGVLQPLQAALNSRLATLLPHKIQAAAVSLLLAWAGCSVVLFASFALSNQSAAELGLRLVAQSKWWMWIGGFFQAAVVAGGVYLPPVLGVSVYYLLLLTAELLSSLVVDLTGAFDSPLQEPSAGRVCGVLLVVAAVVVLQRAEGPLAPSPGPPKEEEEEAEEYHGHPMVKSLSSSSTPRTLLSPRLWPWPSAAAASSSAAAAVAAATGLPLSPMQAAAGSDGVLSSPVSAGASSSVMVTVEHNSAV